MDSFLKDIPLPEGLGRSQTIKSGKNINITIIKKTNMTENARMAREYLMARKIIRNININPDAILTSKNIFCFGDATIMYSFFE